jgi:hypothetical protein
MANEGIMALPQGMPMQGEAPMQGMPMQGEAPVNEQPISVSSADSYDAAQTVLQQRSPEEYAALKAEIRQGMAEVELSAAEISSMLETLVYMSQRPGEYAQLRQNLIDSDAVDAEDIPEEYDPGFLGAMISALHELQLMQFEGAQAPMNDMPPIEGADAMQGVDGGQPLTMAQGGLADVASYMASQGRNGDTMLAHITPGEAQLLRARGGSGTINPVTGLPEFFLKKLWKSVTGAVKKVLSNPIGKVLATVGLAMLLGPTSIGMTLGKAGTAALVSGGVTLAGGGSLKEALMTGAMGYFGGGGTIGGFSPTQALGSFLPGAAGGALNTGLATGLTGFGVGKIGGLSTSDALKMGLTSGVSAAAMNAFGGNPQANASPQPGVEVGGQDYGPQYDGTARSMLAMQPTQAMQPMSYNSPAAAPPSSPGFFESLFGSSSAPAATAGAAPAASSPGFFESLFGSSAAPGTAAASLGSAAPGVATAAAAAAPAAAAAAPGMSMMTKVGLGLGAAALAGGFKNKEDLDEVSAAEKARYLENVRLAKERDAFVRGGGYGLETARITPYNPIVATDYSAAIPMQPGAPVVTPTGITNTSRPIPQPYNLAGLYGVPLVYGQAAPQRLAKGGIPEPTQFPRKNGPINGPGSGTSDDIPAMLSDGEFVFTAKAVRNAGSGSRRKGAARMYKLMKMLEGGPVKGK